MSMKGGGGINSIDLSFTLSGERYVDMPYVAWDKVNKCVLVFFFF